MRWISKEDERRILEEEGFQGENERENSSSYLKIVSKKEKSFSSSPFGPLPHSEMEMKREREKDQVLPFIRFTAANGGASSTWPARGLLLRRLSHSHLSFYHSTSLSWCFFYSQEATHHRRDLQGLTRSPSLTFIIGAVIRIRIFF